MVVHIEMKAKSPLGSSVYAGYAILQSACSQKGNEFKILKMRINIRNQGAQHPV